jgi:membrane-bound ClpP family serine protease
MDRMTSFGVALLVVGALVAVAEAHTPTHGVMGGAGVLLMAIGAALAISSAGAGVLIGVAGGVVLAAAGTGALVLTVGRGLQVRRRRVTTGAEGMFGHVGVVRAWSGRSGSIQLDGAVWQARLSAREDEEDGVPELRPGDRVVAERLDGLTVSVRPAEEWELI